MALLRLVSPPPSGLSTSTTPFPFNLSAPPTASTISSGTSSTTRTPSSLLVSSSQHSNALVTPVKRFPDSSMGIFHGRAMDHGEPGMGLLQCPTCLRIVMEGKAEEHMATCVQTRKELDQIRTSLFSRVIGKRGTQKGGIKRTGSEMTAVSPSPSIESPRKTKRPKVEIAESVASNEEYAASGSNDPLSGRMLLANGKLETKKNFEKRMVGQRKLQKEQEKAAREQEKALKASNLKKEYDPDRHCGVRNDQGDPCKRKLDCKIHLVQQKRDVVGRSLSFDDCLKVQRGDLSLAALEEAAAERANGGTPGPDGLNGRGSVAPSLANGSASGSTHKYTKKNKKKLADARQLATSTFDTHGSGLLEYDTLLQAIRTHTKLNAQIARQRMYGMISSNVPPSTSTPAAPESSSKTPSKGAAAATSDPTKTDTQTRPIRTEQEDVNMDKPAASAAAAEGGSADPSVVGPKPKKPPGTTKGIMRFQAFAGGATSGHWHGDRRRMMAAENTLNEIFKQMRRNQTEVDSKAS